MDKTMKFIGLTSLILTAGLFATDKKKNDMKYYFKRFLIIAAVIFGCMHFLHQGAGRSGGGMSSYGASVVNTGNAPF